MGRKLNFFVLFVPKIRVAQMNKMILGLRKKKILRFVGLVNMGGLTGGSGSREAGELSSIGGSGIFF
jgi:hypothetical protein